MTNKKAPIDYSSIQKKALEQFRRGKSLLDKDGAFVPLFKQFLEGALEAELETHLDESEGPNRKNSKFTKTVMNGEGQFDLINSRERKGTFEPEIIKKRETVLADKNGS
ncbi:MAG: transposase [Chitinophagaceae bacterium]